MVIVIFSNKGTVAVPGTGSTELFIAPLIPCNPICQLFRLFSKLLESFSESLCLCLHYEVFSHNTFRVLDLISRSLVHFAFGFDKGPVSFFYNGYSVLNHVIKE